MLQIATLSVHTEPHPLEEALHLQLTEHGYTLTDSTQANVLICMGTDLQGFDSQALQQLESQITERFLGAELFLLARAFPFARIRVGLNSNQQLLIATPLDESTLYRVIRLLDQYKRLSDVNYEQSMGGFTDLPSVEMPDKEYTASQGTSDFQNGLGESNPMAVAHSTQRSADGWREKLELWHLRPCDTKFTVPPELSHAGIQQVLNSTTQVESRQDPMGQVYGLYGFPDLLRPNAKVLLVTPDGGVVALHRKQNTTILSPLVEDLIFSIKQPFPKWASEVIDRTIPQGLPFALEGTRVYVSNTDNTIYSASTNQACKAEGPTNSVIASLILQWASR